MPVPTVGDLDKNKNLEIIVSMKNGGKSDVLIFEVKNSSNNYMPWPTGRCNLLRNGFFK